jgi:PAS domain S-box-containing protein
MALTAPLLSTAVRSIGRRAPLSVAALLSPTSVLTTGATRTARTARRSAEAALMESEGRYRQLFDHALDAIVFVDDSGRYVEANPAACAMLGWTHDQLLERGPADLMVDLTSFADIEPVWTRFRARGVSAPRAATARGYVRLRRADGTICEAEYAAVANVTVGLHLCVLRDATERRRTERLTAQRLATLDALAGMPANAPVEDLAAAVCAAVVGCGDVPEVAVLAVEPPDRIVIVGAAMADATRTAGLPPIPAGRRAAAIIGAANHGAWVDDWSDVDGQPSEDLVNGLRIAAVAWAPLHAGGQLIGLLAVGGSASATDQRQRLPDLVDLASVIAGSSLGSSLRERASVSSSRDRIRKILDTGAFRPVFQRIVDIESGQSVGYEALTRFDDGTAPDMVFAEASACGLSMELEIATARSALLAASPLPANRFININVSPRLILAREPLRSMLREWGFGVILEITEHSKVDDYDALRGAVADIGDHVQLAVDDAGSGFATLRHILELRPAMVKLDRSLIAGIDTDPARQALVAGLVHFAARLEFSLLAEGVETAAEQTTLLALGVSRAQGYLFGAPVSAADLVASRN